MTLRLAAAASPMVFFLGACEHAKEIPEDVLWRKEEISIRAEDGKTTTRVGYLETWRHHRNVSDPRDKGYDHYKLQDDEMNYIGRIDPDGNFFKYTIQAEYVSVGQWADLINGLKHFFGQSPYANLYIGPVDPFRTKR